MKHIAALFLALATLPATAADDWQWVKVSNNVATGWGTETGIAEVTIRGQTLEAKLFWGPAKTDNVRITLVGTINRNKITATETVLATDVGPSKYGGKYDKQIWKQPFGDAIGTEAITLSDGYNMIGLRRNIAK